MHERFFGLYRADGSLKPMGAVIRDFAASSPRVRRAERPLTLDVTPDSFYAAPERHLPDLYADWLRR